jgi:hypothetical protein
MSVLSILVQIGSLVTLIFAILAIRESKKSRIASVKPILIPISDETPSTYDKLFLYNFDYPIQEFNFHGIAYFNIKNIGKGPATNVRITSVYSSWDEIMFKIGTNNYANIPEGSSIPIILRVGFTDTLFYNGRVRLCIIYEDVLGEVYDFSVDLWLTEISRQEEFICKAKPIAYGNKKWGNIVSDYGVTFREIEDTGYYELEKLSKDRNSKKSTPKSDDKYDNN